MELLQSIMEHRTIRQFREQPVPDLILEKILNAGIRAATTGNMQVYSIIITKKKENIEKLKELHYNQTAANAPLLLTFLADFNRFNKWCRLRKAEPGYDNFLSFYTASIDALLVAQNVAIAAEALGFGTCYLGTTLYNLDKFIEFFKCPKGVVPVTTLAIGYPAEEPELTDRLPVKAVIHEEFYHDYTDSKINDFYKTKEKMPFYKKIVEQNQVPTLAHVFTEKRYTKKDNVAISKKFLEVLKTQDFMNHDE